MNKFEQFLIDALTEGSRSYRKLHTKVTKSIQSMTGDDEETHRDAESKLRSLIGKGKSTRRRGGLVVTGEKPKRTSGRQGRGVPAEDHPTFGKATSRPETVPGRRAARRAVARTAGQPEAERRKAGEEARKAEFKRSGVKESFEQFLIEELFRINEIGDTEKGKKFIHQAFEKRRKEDADASKAAEVAYGGGTDVPEDAKDILRIEKGRLQMKKVSAYMSGREDHEEAAKTPKDVKGYNKFRGALKKATQARKKQGKKAQQRDIDWTPPKGKAAVTKDLGDYGARVGKQDYKEKYGEHEKKVRRASQILNVTGPTGRGVRQTMRKAQERARATKWREN